MDELNYFNDSQKHLTFLCNKILKKLFNLTNFLSKCCDFNRALLLLLISKFCTIKTINLICLKFFSLININSIQFSNNYALNVINEWHSSLRSFSNFFAYYQRELWLNILCIKPKTNFNITFIIKRQLRYEAYRIIFINKLCLNETIIEFDCFINEKQVKKFCDIILICVWFDLNYCKEERYIKFVIVFFFCLFISE